MRSDCKKEGRQLARTQWHLYNCVDREKNPTQTEKAVALQQETRGGQRSVRPPLVAIGASSTHGQPVMSGSSDDLSIDSTVRPGSSIAILRVLQVDRWRSDEFGAATADAVQADRAPRHMDGPTC